MAKDTIQQVKTKQSFSLIFLVLLTFVTFSSCVQLRYTDYGRPFDFLKSKNQHYKMSKTEIDTANIAHSNINSTCEKKLAKSSDSVIKSPNLATDKFPLLSATELKETLENSGLVNKFPIHKKAQNILKVYSGELISNGNRNAITINQDDFWGDFWSFVLKWLLIILAIIIAAALVIWGLYLLITLLAGPIAASIFLAIVILLLYLAFEF